MNELCARFHTSFCCSSPCPVVENSWAISYQDLQLREEHREILFKGMLKRGPQEKSKEVQVFLLDHALLFVKTSAKTKDLKVYRKVSVLSRDRRVCLITDETSITAYPDRLSCGFPSRRTRRTLSHGTAPYTLTTQIHHITAVAGP
jgi:hypothetical protein